MIECCREPDRDCRVAVAPRNDALLLAIASEAIFRYSRKISEVAASLLLLALTIKNFAPFAPLRLTRAIRRLR